MFCTETKQARLSYQFYGGEGRLYLIRQSPFEVKIKEGLPGRYPHWNGMANRWRQQAITGGGSGDSFAEFAGAFYTTGGPRGAGRHFYSPSVDRTGAVTGFYVSDYSEPSQDGTVYPLALVSSTPFTMGGLGLIRPTATIEVLFEGRVIFSDFGPGPASYKVSCGNGCVEDEEITVTEVSSYPGHWCLTEEEMNKLRRADRILQNTGKNLDNHLRELNAENDRLRRELSKPLPRLPPDPAR